MKEVKAGTKAEALGECYLLACYLWLPQLSSSVTQLYTPSDAILAQQAQPAHIKHSLRKCIFFIKHASSQMT